MIILPIVISPSFSHQMILIVSSWLFSHGEKTHGPRIMRKLWSTQNNKKEQAEDSSYTKGIEGMLRETARKSYPDRENIDSPMMAPQDYEVRQSRRVLELQNSDFWIRPTDLSWHSPILVTIRELPFKKLPWEVAREVGSQGRSQDAEDSEKQKEDWD